MEADVANEVAQFVEDVEDFLTNTEDARVASQRCRDYKDHKQWTAEEEAKMLGRHQAPITVNRIKPKVEGLKGLLVNRKTDPKAYARTPYHEKAAEVVTDGLRYVADNTNFDKVKLCVAENDFVEGYGAAFIGVKKKGQGVEVDIKEIPWDRYYYDTHSTRLDFEDKRYDGIILWLHVDEVVERYGISKKEAESLINSQETDDGFETFDDKPRWADRKNRRVRICQHYYIKKGVWHTCHFTKNGYLPAYKGGPRKPIVSPYIDEDGNPVNPIVGVSANIDRDNNRFGEVHYWLDLQDEINHRRSKYLFLLSVRQTAGRKGAIKDVKALKRELSKADGHIEYEGEKGDFELLKTQDMADAQFTLLQDAKMELDAVGFNAQLSGERQGDLSGRAISNLQDAATNELSSLFAGLTDWEIRVYRHVWMRMKQFWTDEKWIRILDDADKTRWVGFNQPITYGALLQEKIEDTTIPEMQRMQIAQELQQMAQINHPALNQVVETRNPIAEMEMDILIKVAPDSINTQREQFELLANIAQTRPEIPFTEVLKLSELRGKDKIIKSIEESSAQAAQRNQAVQDATIKAELEEKASKTHANHAKAGKDEASRVKELASADKLTSEADQTDVQTELLEKTPPKDSGMVV